MTNDVLPQYFLRIMDGAAMIELPRVLVNMARSIPMWLWYWSP